MTFCFQPSWLMIVVSDLHGRLIFLFSIFMVDNIFLIFTIDNLLFPSFMVDDPFLQSSRLIFPCFQPSGLMNLFPTFVFDDYFVSNLHGWWIFFQPSWLIILASNLRGWWTLFFNLYDWWTFLQPSGLIAFFKPLWLILFPIFELTIYFDFLVRKDSVETSCLQKYSGAFMFNLWDPCSHTILRAYLHFCYLAFMASCVIKK